MNRRPSALSPEKLRKAAVQEEMAARLASGTLVLNTPHDLLGRERLFCRHPQLNGFAKAQMLALKKADELFQKILKRMLSAQPTLSQGFFAGYPVEVYSQSPSCSLAARLLLGQKPSDHLLSTGEQAIRLYHDPLATPASFGISFPLEKFALFDFAERRALILGSAHPGEIRAALETFAHFLLPQKGIFSVNGRATCNAQGESTVLQIGEGAATYLRRDRRLIGEGLLAWSPRGLSAGAAAGEIALSGLHPERHQDFWKALEAPTSLLENPSLLPDGSLARRGHSARAIGTVPLPNYPAYLSGETKAPTALVFLCTDPLGALPPVARLSADQAYHYFLSGYGALPGVESLFRPCFGSAEELPQLATRSAELLRQRVKESGASVWILNTAPGNQTMPAEVRRALLDGILNRSLENAGFTDHAVFGFQTPNAFASAEPRWLRGHQGAVVQELARRYQDHLRQFIPSFSGSFRR